jgi:hypothetical protein
MKRLVDDEATVPVEIGFAKSNPFGNTRAASKLQFPSVLSNWWCFLRRNPLTVSYLFLALILTGCPMPPVATMTKTPPTVSWAIKDFASRTVTNYTDGAVAHINPDSTLILSFQAEAPNGLTAMSLRGTGSVWGGAFTTDPTWLVGGPYQVTIANESKTFNPAITAQALAIIGFNYYAIDCNTKLTDNRGVAVEAHAQPPGSITLTGTATDTFNRTTTATLNLVVP